MASLRDIDAWAASKGYEKREKKDTQLPLVDFFQQRNNGNSNGYSSYNDKVAAEMAADEKSVADTVKEQQEENKSWLSKLFENTGTKAAAPSSPEMEAAQKQLLEAQTKFSQYEDSGTGTKEEKAAARKALEEAKARVSELEKKTGTSFLDSIFSGEKISAEEAQRTQDSLWQLARMGGGGGIAGYGAMTQAAMNLATDTSYKEPNDNWTEDQKKEYYLKRRLNPKGADEYAISINNELNKQEAGKQAASVQEFASNHPVLSTVGAVASDVVGLGNADFISRGLEKIARGTVTDKAYLSPFEAAQAGTGAVAQSLNDYGTLGEGAGILAGKGFGDAYQLAESVLASVGRARMLGGIDFVDMVPGVSESDKIAKWIPSVGDITAFGNAAAAGLKDAKDRGATDEQAFALAVANGMAEAIGEHIGLEDLKSLNNPKLLANFWGNLGKSMLTEAWGEGETSVINEIADRVIMGDKSNFDTDIKKFMAENPSATKEEATDAVWKQHIFDIAFDALAGGVSGGISSAGQQAITKINSNGIQQNAQTETQTETKTETQNTQQEENTQNEVKEATEQNTPDTPRTMVQEAVDTLKSGGKVSSNQIDAILSDSESVAQLSEAGVDFGDTKSDARNAVRDFINQTAAQNEVQQEDTRTDAEKAFDLMAQEAPNAQQQEQEQTQQEKDVQAALDLLFSENAQQETENTQNQEEAKQQEQEPEQQTGPQQQEQAQPEQSAQEEAKTPTLEESLADIRKMKQESDDRKQLNDALHKKQDRLSRSNPELRAEQIAHREDSKIYEQETKRIIREYEKENKKTYQWAMDIQDEWVDAFKRQAKKYGDDIEGLKKALAKQAADNKKDQAQLVDIYNKMVAEYQKADHKVDLLTDRIAAIKESAKQKAESQKRTKLRTEVKDIVSDLRKELGTNDRKHHVQEAQKSAVAKALGAIDMMDVDYSAKIESLNERFDKAVQKGDIEAARKISDEIARQKALQDKKSVNLSEMRDAYKQMAESTRTDERNLYSDHIMDMIDATIAEIGDTPLYEMDSTQLTLVSNMYSEILASVKKANKELKYAQNMSISEAAEAAAAALRDSPDKKKENNAAQTFLGINNQKPIHAAQYVDSPVFQSATENLMKAEDKQGKNVAAVRSAIDEVEARHDSKSLGLDKTHTVKGENGKTVELPVSALLAIYEYSKSESAMSHVTGDGVVLNVEGKKGRKSSAVTISADTVQDIVDNVLTDKQKAYADDYCATVLGLTADMINDVSMEDAGIKIADSENYFPIFTLAQNGVNPTSIDAYPSFMNMGMLNARKNASNAIIIDDFRNLVARHSSQAITYNSYAIALDEYHRILNNVGSDGKSLLDHIERVYGRDVAKYFSTLEQDIVKRQSSDSRTAFINKMISKQKSAATMANISTIAQQPTAILRATSVIDAKYLTGKAVEKVKGGMNAQYKQFEKYCGIATLKEMGLYDIGMGKSVEGYLKPDSTPEGIKGKAKAFVTDTDYRNEIVSSLPGLADKWTWVQIWEASKRMAADTTNLKGEALLEKAGEIATKALQETQVYDSVLSRSGNMRSSDTTMKMATAFMAESTTSINMVQSGVRDIQNGIKNGDESLKKQGGRKIAAVAASSVLNATVVAAVRATLRSFLGDDEDKTWTEKFVKQWTGAMLDEVNPLTKLPFARDLWSFFNGYDVERMDVSLATSFIKKLQSASNYALEDTSEMTDEELKKYMRDSALAYVDLLGSVSSLFSGLNPAIIVRDIVGLVSNFTDGVDRGTSKNTIKAAFLEELSEIPGFGKFFKQSKDEQLYDAATSGDAAYFGMVAGKYTEKELNSKLRTTLRNNDPRIGLAADAKSSGDYTEYERIMKEILDEGNFRSSIIDGAISAEIAARKPGADKEYSDEQFDMIGQLDTWKEFGKLPASTQAKVEELVYSKDSFEKYSSPSEFAAAAMRSQLNSSIDTIRDEFKDGKTGYKPQKEMEAVYNAAKKTGTLDQLFEMSDGTAQNYIQAREDGYSSSDFFAVYREYYRTSQNDNLDQSAKALQFRNSLEQMVEAGDISRKDADYWQKAMQFTRMSTVSTNAYDEQISRGSSADDAKFETELINSFKTDYKKANGDKNPSDALVFDAIVGGSKNQSDDAIISAFMSQLDDYKPDAEKPETSELKVQYLYNDMGLTPREIADVWGAFSGYSKKNDITREIQRITDEDGNQRFSSAEARQLYDLYKLNGNWKQTLINLYG